MGTQAKVTSTEALEAFRANLIVFLNKAHRSVDDVSDEARRMRLWLQHDQRVHWESEARKRARSLAQAEQELMSVRLSGTQQNALAVRQAAVNKAKHAMDEANEKLRRVKTWTQNYDGYADPIVKRLESLRQFLSDDMPKAIAYLVNVQRTLAAYSSLPSAESVSAATSPPPETEEAAASE